jgi:hypothetical protein
MSYGRRDASSSSAFRENAKFPLGMVKTSIKVDPADENDLLIVLDAFGQPTYKIQDELYHHYILTYDHRRVKPMSKEEFTSFLRHMESQRFFSSHKKDEKIYWKHLISFKDFEKED